MAQQKKTTNDNKLEKIEQQLERDIRRMTELYDEISTIVKRIHLLGMEQGSIQTYLAITEKETDK